MGNRAMKKLLFVFALLFASPALAQWQAPDHSVPIGRGGGATGFKFAAPSTAGLPLASNGATSDPSFQQLLTGGVADNAITSPKIAAGAVLDVKIAAGAATNAKLVSGAANTAKGSVDGVNVTDQFVNFSVLPQANALEIAAVPSAQVVTISNGLGTVTFSGAVPPANTPVQFTTTGALPNPLVVGTVYYIVGSTISGSTARIASTAANAIAGTAMTTSTAGSGTHTLTANGTIPAGYKGHIDEITQGSGGAPNVPFQTVTQITSLTQPAGIYDCSGESFATTAGGALASEYHSTITTTVPPALQGLPASGGGNGSHIIYVANNSAVFNFGPRRFVLTAPTVIYLTMYMTFGNNAGVGNNGAGSATAQGYLRCETK